MKLVTKARFINSISGEFIVEVAMYKAEIGFEILTRSKSTIEGEIRISEFHAREFYNKQLNENRKGLQAMEVIYEIRS